MNAEQTTRREKLIELMNQNRCWPSISARPSAGFADYDESYEELAGTYLGIEWSDSKKESQGTPEAEIPRYAGLVYDETYSMIHVTDSLTEALAYSQGDDGEYLTGGGGVTDLDTGERIEQQTLVLTSATYEALRELLAKDNVQGQLPDGAAQELAAALSD
jgi:hypothetical protein